MKRERPGEIPPEAPEPVPGRGPGQGSVHDDYDFVEAGAREHYEDALLYEYEYRRRRDDVRFYCRMADELLGGSGRILELACGAGRVSVPLVRAGHTVVAFDRSGSMLQRAQERIAGLGQKARQRAFLFQGDMCRFALGERFPLLISAFNSFEHLYTRVEVSECLARVREHLLPGGAFLFDVQNPDVRWLLRGVSGDPQKRWARTQFTHPATGERLIYSTSHDYDPVSQIALIRLFYEPADGKSGPARVVTLSQRKFFPAELEALIHANGMTVDARFGDFDGGPLYGDSAAQVLLCRVPG